MRIIRAAFAPIIWNAALVLPVTTVGITELSHTPPRNVVGARNYFSVAARWLACVIPCRRFASALTGDDARLGADVGRYSFIVTDLHRPLLAGLPVALRVKSGHKDIVGQKSIQYQWVDTMASWLSDARH